MVIGHPHRNVPGSSSVRASKGRLRLEKGIRIKGFCWGSQQREEVERRISKVIEITENKERPKEETCRCHTVLTTIRRAVSRMWEACCQVSWSCF